MSKASQLANTPLDGLNYHFVDYLKEKKEYLAKRMDGNGVPNYAYASDYELRKRLDSIPGLMKLARTLQATVIPAELQKYNMIGIAVGPTQFPEIYKMVRDCAETLGIGIPNLLVVPYIDFGGGATDDFNAATIASDDVEPIVLVTGLMVERLSPEELKDTIGHECGHIHNYHGTYQLLARMIANLGTTGLLSLPGLRQFAGLLTMSTQLALTAWNRAAEVSADRGGMICSGSLDASIGSHVKSLYGAYIDRTVQSPVDLDALRAQMDMTMGNLNRFNELMNTHPLSIKRVFAAQDFYQCEKFYEWRPDLKKPDMKLYSKAEVDARCKKYLSVVAPEGGKK